MDRENSPDLEPSCVKKGKKSMKINEREVYMHDIYLYQWMN